VDLLVSLSGFSPITTILAFEVLRPKRLLVISSEKASAGIEVIGNHVVGPGKLKHADFRNESCNPTDPRSIFELVRPRVPGKSDGTTVNVIDITGGKKVMSATGSLAAWQLNLAFCYVDSEYDAATRAPVPGSEQLVTYDNPTALFETQELDTARRFFDQGGFEEAAAKASALCERMDNPREARLLRDLANFYVQWRNLNFARALGSAKALEGHLSKGNVFEPNQADAIRKQRAHVEKLASGDRVSLLLNYFLLGLHYLDLGRYDFATLLFYRTLEGCFAERLSRRFKGFSTSSANYALLGTNRDELLAKYKVLSDYARDRDAGLPDQLGFMSSAVLLAALGDELAIKARLVDRVALNELQELASIRNGSVLAHGFQTISPEQAEKFSKAAKKHLAIFWEFEVPGERLFPIDPLRFVKLAKS
jgi:CRISPR-associated protein (TIGR02710 family)